MKSINLLPRKQKKERSISYISIVIVITAAIFALALQSSFYYIWSLKGVELSTEIGSVNAKISKLEEDGQSREIINRFNAAVATLVQLKEQRPEYLPYLAAITGYLPVSAEVVFIEASEKNKLEMQLDFTNYSESVAYMEKLESSPQLEQALFGSFIKKVEKENETNHPKTTYEMLLQVTFAGNKGVNVK